MDILYLCDRLGECRCKKYGSCNNDECFHTSNEKHAKFKTPLHVCIYSGEINCLIETTGACRHPSDKCFHRFGVLVQSPDNQITETMFCSVVNCIWEGGADDEKNL